MRIRKTLIVVWVIISMGLINVGQVFPQDDQELEKMAVDEDLEQEFKWLKAETFVITPSRIPEKIKKTASSITVITDRQIRQMGTKDLTDLLIRAVPSVYGAQNGNPGAINIRIRGKTNINSNPILFMINSHPINEVRTGGATWVHDTLIVDNIRRIEVLRSPGSSVYGANAFLGVINIITKEAEDIDGFELTARGGSWDTQQYNLLYGRTFTDVEVAFNFNYFKTHGFRGFIEEDAQTQYDQFWGAFGFPPASLAPGRMAGDREKYDVALNLKYKGFEFDGRFVDKEWDTPIGWAYALNHKSISPSKDYYLNLSYETSIVDGLDLFGKVYRNLFDFENDLQVLPPGAVVLTPGLVPAIMPDGMNLKSHFKSSRTGVEIQATCKIRDTNTIVSGATYEEQKDYGTLSGNYLPTANPVEIIPLPSITEWPADTFGGATQKRHFKAFFIEHIWDITDNLRLTAGARYDSYSDFGSEVSPRAGLTWEFIKGYDLKLLYAHAFRAPSFAEIENKLPSIELGPETVDTYEISLGADITSSFSSRVTFYYDVGEDAIFGIQAAAPWYWANSSEKLRDHGFEIEARYDFGKGTYLAGHYNYQSLGWGTLNEGSIISNIRLSRYLNFYIDCQFYGSEERWFGEVGRDDLSGYAVVNTTLIAKKFLKGYEGLEIRGSIYNLLDEEYKTQEGPELPNDLPKPGINFLLEMKYTF